VADVGFLCRNGRSPVTGIATILGRLRVPGILARCGAARRVRLSPEGSDLDHLKACARALYMGGVRAMIFSFHSPSVVPGNTPYVRSRDDLDEFLRRIDKFLLFFRDELGGAFASPDEILAMALERETTRTVAS
jgi:hypothetical protein